MMFALRSLLVMTLPGILIALPAQAAMYKWVDENGGTHYGDSVPPKYANRVSERSSKAGALPVKAERAHAAVEARPTEQELEKQKAQAKQELERQRRDTALLSTYASEGEIELARERELRRNQDTLKMATAGLAKSKEAEDRKKLDGLMNLAREETDNINAKFDAQKTRFRELTRGATTAQAQTPAAKP